ncbi:DUF1622 domain-containing protein [Patescibacteria group bacterium]|nr:DUF1622 domain-containing protein [Patescibacteria group bacterium]MBU1673067.1 DUF1622 domain-containing protein [Patescibacteria group bacterium]MBU1963673.1 DUF1622 domain-containing protein [Patescibacteria group bacterium]
MAEQLVDWITLIIKIIGGAVILFGMIESSYHFIKKLSHKLHKYNVRELDEIRLEFGRYILLGLEFFIAADVFQTIFLPSWSELGQLALIVAIRTVLSYFLNYEFKIIEERKS